MKIPDKFNPELNGSRTANAASAPKTLVCDACGSLVDGAKQDRHVKFHADIASAIQRLVERTDDLLHAIGKLENGIVRAASSDIDSIKRALKGR